MALPDLATLASLATSLTLVVALVFGAIQVRQVRHQKRQAALSDVIRSMQTRDIVEPMRAIMELPLDAPAERVAGDRAARTAATSAIVCFEGYGMMVHSRTIDLHDLDRAGGGVVRGCWNRLRRYVEAQRAQHHDPNFGEWFQWLAERMEDDPAPGKAEGAHRAYRSWRR